MPQGVDLNLDKFNLSRIEKFAGTMPAAAGTNGSLEAKVTLSKAFLKGLRDRNLDIKKTMGACRMLDDAILLYIFFSSNQYIKSILYLSFISRLH